MALYEGTDASATIVQPSLSMGVDKNCNITELMVYLVTLKDIQTTRNILEGITATLN